MSDAFSNLAIARSVVHCEWLPFFDHHNALLLEIFENLSYKISTGVITPDLTNIFRAFEIPSSHIRVVIVGQDPYPTPGVSIGRAFAVSSTTALPPSLRNIEKEIQQEFSSQQALDRTLQSWADQGVFLLNTALTFDVTKQETDHFELWSRFTADVLRHISQSGVPQLWMLWGNKAQRFRPEGDSVRVLITSHPSPLSAYRGFLGSDIFLKCNHHLHDLDLPEIDWMKS